MGTISLAKLAKSKELKQGLPKQDERTRFNQEVIMGNDGVYLSYLSDFYDFVYKIESFGKRTKQVLTNSGVPTVEAKLQITEKIPSAMIHRMIAWYRDVENRYGTEATMQVFYDKTGGSKDFPQELKDKYEGSVKREGNFVYVIPEQSVTGGFVTFHGQDFPQKLTSELYDWALANYEPILNIHSHNHMDAFWSGTDDKNELPLFTRLCLVVGKVDTDKPRFRFSWNFEGKRHHQEANIDTFIEPLQLKTTIEGLGYETVEEIGFDKALGMLDYDHLEFDERWYDRLKARGSFGANFNKYKKLEVLDKRDYEPTGESAEEIEYLIKTGDYVEEDVELEEDEFEDAEENEDEDLDDDGFHGGEINHLDTEEDFGDVEGWRKDLMNYKDKVLGRDLDKPVSKVNGKPKTNTEVSSPTSFRREPKQPLTKKSGGVFEKFRKEKLAEDKGKEPHQTTIWDDVGMDK